jgi:cyclopropane fatty-acyl-phospholipid synthase-like methyltransferase
MDRDYFEQIYACGADPWGFASSAYERDKYATSLAALPDGRFAAAMEVGCSIGIFTRSLAPRCDSLAALDIAENALERARVNCPAAHVRFLNQKVPECWPDGCFDLIVLSEVLYYLTTEQLRCVVDRVRESLTPGGTVLLVHFLGETDYPLTGDAAADGFIAWSGLDVYRQQRTPLYRVDVLRATGRTNGV